MMKNEGFSEGYNGTWFMSDDVNSGTDPVMNNLSGCSSIGKNTPRGKNLGFKSLHPRPIAKGLV